MAKVGIGLYGTNGHQIHGPLREHPRGQLVAMGAFAPAAVPEWVGRDVPRYTTLDELLADARVELVSLCSPRRRDQARDAIRCLEAGKHVYAEKPCAMTEQELDEVIATSRRTGRLFHDMAGTAFGQPWIEMRKVVAEGAIGTVVQVLAQKSYPWHPDRPQDEDVDGGMLMQVGVHAMRFIEHVAGVRVAEVSAVETQLGNPKSGGLHMAAAAQMRLANGGLATLIANYLNPRGLGIWGNDALRIFGTEGMVEAVDGGTRTRLVVRGEDRGALPVTQPEIDYLDRFLQEIRGEAPMPIDLEAELHPTRMIIRAKRAAAQL